MSFADLGLSDELLRAVSESGYDEPTPIQRQAIPSVLMGRDIIGIAQTGTGKTAGFVLPMIDILAQGRSRARMPRSLILEPTRELAAQVAENFEKYGKYHKLSMALLIGGVSMGDQIKALEKGVDVLIATPGRLMDLFGRGKIMLNGCSLLVIDEADRMLDMGFIPDIEEICTKLPPDAADPALLGDDAAADQEARRQVPHQSQDDRGRRARPRPTLLIDQRMIRVDRAQEARRARRPAARRRRPQRARLLQPQDHGARARHQPQARPASTSARSRATWSRPTGSASSTASRRTRSTSSSPPTSPRAASTSRASATSSTIDVPWHPDDYIHRIGRTGRAGKTGIAITLVTSADAESIDNIQKLTGTKIAEMGDAPRRSAAAREERDAARSSAAPRAARAAKAAPRSRRERRARERPKREPREKPRSRPARSAKSASPAASAPPEPEPADDGWNGPVPSFLGKGFGG